MKMHILICTPHEKFRLFSNEEILSELLSIYKGINTGEISCIQAKLPERSYEQRLSDEPISIFDDINIKITFRDENAQKKSINMKFRVKFTKNFMHLTSNFLLKLKNSGNFDKNVGKKEIPLITEDNLYKIFTIAKELGVKWLLLTNFNFKYPKIVSTNYHFITGFINPGSLLLELDSCHGKFVLELKNPRLFTNSPTPELIEIKKIIKSYSENC